MLPSLDRQDKTMEKLICALEEVAASMGECEAHKYMTEMMSDLKRLVEKLSDNQQDHKELVIRLTENFLEMQRQMIKLTEGLKDLKDYNAVQDERIETNAKFMVRATAILGFIVIVAPAIGWFINKMQF